MSSIFSNTKEAFSLKSNFELNRALFLFRIIGNKSFVKITTSLTRFALKYNLPFTSLIKITVFDHFCGGLNEKECIPLIQKLYNKNVFSVLDFSTEGFETEEEFDLCLEKKISIIDFVKGKKEIPFVVFKPTCLGSFSLFSKVSSNVILNKEEKLKWSRVVERFEKICKKASQENIKILIDASN